METKENKQENQQNSQSQKSDSSGFNLDGLLKDGNFAEILKHLLSGAGAMAGNYFLWIKPIQDKIEALSKVVNEQDKRIKELEEEQDDLKEEIKQLKINDKYEEEVSGFNPLRVVKNKQEYFTFKRKASQNSNGQGHYKRVSF